MSAERLAEAIRQEAVAFEDFIAREMWCAEMLRRAAAAASKPSPLAGLKAWLDSLQ